MLPHDWATAYWALPMGSALLAAFIIAYIYPYRHIRGIRLLMLLMAAASEWAFAYAMELLVPTIAGKMFWVRMVYIGGPSLGLLFLLFISSVTRKDGWVTWRRVVLLALTPAATMVLAWTPGTRALIWPRVWLITHGPVSLLGFERGIWFWVNLGYSYLLIAAGTLLLVQACLKARYLYRKQLQILLIGEMVPWIANALYVFGYSPSVHLDITSFAFSISGVAFVFGIFRYQLFDIVPIARQMVLEAIEDAVFAVDLRGRILDSNGAAQYILGMDLAALRGAPFATTMPDLFSRIHHLRQTQPQAETIRLSNPRDTRDYYLRVYPLFNYRGKLKGWVHIFQDITERKAADEERLRLRSQLQHAQKMEVMGTLAGSVAHDLNNILSGIVGYPDLLLMKLDSESPMRRSIVQIQASGKKAAAIVEDLLTLARGGVKTEEVASLNAIIEQYLDSPECKRMRSFHPGVSIHTDLALDLKPVLGSFVHLSKMVMNLVSNAAEAIPGGGDIFITTENGTLSTQAEGSNACSIQDGIVLRIRDTGIGISAQDIDRIFEPFYTKKKMGRSGTGLGMAVVWGTVQDHHGDIHVESQPNAGTTVTIRIPATRQTPAPAPAPAESLLGTFLGKGESVLIVDDVSDQRNILSEMLATLGYRVDAVASGEAAVDHIRRHQADLIILDMIMDPGIDGLETYQRISKIRPGQKAIIISGYSETDRVRQAMCHGVGRYVKKPCSIETIGTAVRSEIDRTPASPAAGNAMSKTVETTN